MTGTIAEAEEKDITSLKVEPGDEVNPNIRVFRNSKFHKLDKIHYFMQLCKRVCNILIKDHLTNLPTHHPKSS